TPEAVGPDRVVVIHNGIDIERFDRMAAASHGRGSGAAIGPTIAVLANLRPEKGHLVFVEAAERVLQSYPDAQFVIAGDGPERERIAARIAGSRAAPHIRMIGAVNNVPAFLREVDVVAVPSLTNEALPNST